jgi:hypothetical protein
MTHPVLASGFKQYCLQFMTNALRHFIEKLVVAELLDAFSKFLATLRTITTFTRANSEPEAEHNRARLELRPAP